MNIRFSFTIISFFILLMGVFGCASSQAQGEGDGMVYEPEVNYIKIDSVIDNNYAITEITEEFYNPYDHAVSDIFSFRIPEKAFISNFSLTMDGATHYAKVVSKELAKQQYNESVASGKDAGLVESHGKSTFTYSVSLSPKQTLTVGLRYEEFLEKTLGDYTYTIFLTSGNIDSVVEKLDINVAIKSQLKFTDIQVPDYSSESTISNSSSTEELVSYSATSAEPTKDFIVIYKLEPVNINGKMLNYVDATTGFFSHVFSPQVGELGGSPMDKEIIFVLDKSGSMSGTKIQQLKNAFDEIVHELRSADTFNVIMFDSTITKYQTELMTASQTNQDAAAGFINDISAGGSTNINSALTTALDMFGDTSETVPIIVFLTDGLPTAGTTDTATIRSNILEHNTGSVAIFSLGFGNDVDFEFLKALSLENSGHAVRIEEGSDAKEQLTDFYDTISTPLLKDLKFEYPLDAYEVYPTYVDQLFEGSECVIVGKYNTSATSLTANVYTTGKDGERIFSQTFELKDSSEHSFIPRLWAYTKINHLLDELTVLGYDEILVGEVVTLAMEYQFVTPYTSLLITVEEPEEEEEPPEKVIDDGGTAPDAHVNNGAQPFDSDGDGVGDSYDEFPNDPTKSKRPKEKDDDDGGAGEDVSPITEESYKKIISLNFFFIAIAFLIIFSIIIITIAIVMMKRK
ncbi:MAG: VWA domain-containing protein [Thermoplasmata archaeon]|nr:MAG: VWA domain-containing protein [Thermoplasmata archaeon]